MKNLLYALLVVGMLPAFGSAEPYFGSATEQEISNAKKEAAEKGKEAARKASAAKERAQRIAGVKFDWDRDAVLIQGTDAEPLADWSWCDDLLESKYRGKGFCMRAFSSDFC